MCGIAGIVSSRHAPETVRSMAQGMQRALVHRGPDDEGLWQSDCGQAVLAHRRLAILDLSPGGHQPMSSVDGRYTICFNGEIYNFRALRAELEKAGVEFQSQSDTEVIVKLFEREGVESMKKLRGMFALAIWDSVTRRMFLARDPLGIKPLYVHRSPGVLAFASELRALCGSGLFGGTLNPQAVRRYLESGSVPEPLTLVQEVECLEAGRTLLWQEGSGRIQSFWQLSWSGQEAVTEDAVEFTRKALADSVRHHFVSDVPVGVFLSGGIDSTAVLAMANETGQTGVRAFSIGVDDPAADESAVARRTAQHFEADYHEMRLDGLKARALFGEFLQHMDQPSVDGLNTYTVSSLAREHGMKVVLSGLGGDELFGGYSSFSKIPKMLRWHSWARSIPGLVPLLQRSKPQHRRLAEFLLSPGTIDDAYASLRGIFARGEAVKLTSWITGQAVVSNPHSMASNPSPAAEVADEISRLELTRYMRNQLLRDSDVMSMAHGLELRVPLVDSVLVQKLARIPAATRLQPGKRLLTDAVREVPEWVVNQKKRGFLFPYEKWLTRDWGSAFAEASKGAPVPVVTWYQKWVVFVLRHCMANLGL